MAYEIRFLVEAEREIEKLDKNTVSRIFRKLSWLAENADDIRGEGLRAALAGHSKIREGDYRIIYKLSPDEKLIIVRTVGHRSEVYKRR